VREDIIEKVQREHKEWAHRNFGPRPSWHPLLGVQEEVGELSHAYLKREQGIRGTREEHEADMCDAVGDIMVFLIDFCNQEGIDLRDALAVTWEKVSKRDWRAERLANGKDGG
jgi:NTP pyrophosphatase (non-canonical NTP hydrolase)